MAIHKIDVNGQLYEFVGDGFEIDTNAANTIYFNNGFQYDNNTIGGEIFNIKNDLYGEKGVKIVDEILNSGSQPFIPHTRFNLNKNIVYKLRIKSSHPLNQNQILIWINNGDDVQIINTIRIDNTQDISIGVELTFMVDEDANNCYIRPSTYGMTSGIDVRFLLIKPSIYDYLGNGIKDDVINLKKSFNDADLNSISIGTGDGAFVSVGKLNDGCNQYGCVAVGCRNLIKNVGAKNVTVGNDNMSGDGTDSPTSGNKNTSMGYHSLYRLTSGENNASFGAEAEDDNTSGSFNTAMGAYSLQRNSKGSNNTALGYGALNGNSYGIFNESANYNSNIAIGVQSLYNIYNGSNNIAIGNKTLYNSKFIKGCICIGNNTGFQNTEDNIFIISNDTCDSTTALLFGRFNVSNPSEQELTINAGKIILDKIPTTDPKINGMLWNDNGFLKISLG